MASLGARRRGGCRNLVPAVSTACASHLRGCIGCQRGARNLFGKSSRRQGSRCGVRRRRVQSRGQWHEQSFPRTAAARRESMRRWPHSRPGRRLTILPAVDCVGHVVRGEEEKGWKGTRDDQSTVLLKSWPPRQAKRARAFSQSRSALTHSRNASVANATKHRRQRGGCERRTHHAVEVRVGEEDVKAGLLRSGLALPTKATVWSRGRGCSLRSGIGVGVGAVTALSTWEDVKSLFTSYFPSTYWHSWGCWRASVGKT